MWRRVLGGFLAAVIIAGWLAWINAAIDCTIFWYTIECWIAR